MRSKTWLLKLAALVIAGALLLVGCGGAPGGGSGGPSGSSPNTSEGGETTGDGQGTEHPGTGQEGAGWEEATIDGLPDEVRSWVEEHQQQMGIFQEVFDGRTYVLVAWGEKPTGGYAVEVTDVTVDGETLHLAVALSEPASDATVTQALTYPHALVAVTPGRIYQIQPEFSGAIFLQNRSFRIELPEMFTAVDDRVRVKGQARVFEGAFQIYVEDGHNILAEQTMQVEGAPAWGAFDVELELRETPTSPNGVVTVLTHSPKDGSVLDPIHIPISFTSWQ